MDSIQKITIDVSDPLNTQVVKAVQEDIRSRYVEITLVRNGEPLSIPASAHGMIGIRRSNGTYVLYDETEDQTSAVTIDGNVVTAYLSQEALAIEGDLYTSVSIYTASQRLTAFHFIVSVEATAVPSGVVVESDYFNILEGVVSDAIDAADRAEQAAATFQSHAATHLPNGSDPIPLASTTSAGLVQLYNGVDSDSTTLAATAAAVKAAYNHGGGGGGGTQANWNETDPLDPSYIQNKPTAMTPTAHASTHATGGSDPITPASIGAMAAGATPTPAAHAASHASTGSDPITPASIGAMASNATPTPANHAASHAAGGYDALTPAAIGAASTSHASTHEIGGTDALPSASTSQAGLVQIYDGVDSTSTTMAASANAVRLAYNHGGGGGGGGTQANWNETDPLDPSYIQNKPTSMTPTAHASTHATGGTDAITPADIGAAAASDLTGYIPTSDKGSASGVATLDSNSKVTASQTSSRLSAFNSNKTLALSDAGLMHYSDSTSALTVTIPTNANVAFPTGTEMEFLRWNSGTVTFATASGANLYSADSKKTISHRYGCVVLKKVGENNWILAGDVG